MKKNIRIFLLYTYYSMKTQFQHRASALSFLLGKILKFTLYLFFLYALVTHTKLLAGYTVSQSLVFFLTFNFMDSAVQMLFREVYRFKPLVVNGELDGVLTKPYHPFLKVLFGGVDSLDVIMTLPYLLILAYVIWSGKGYSPLHLFFYFILLINGFILAAGFHILILAMTVFTEEVDHFIMLYRDATRMVAFPIDIYRGPVHAFLMFIIPVGIMMAVPVKSLFGTLSTGVLFASIAISLVFFFGSLYVWKIALKKYQSAGS